MSLTPDGNQVAEHVAEARSGARSSQTATSSLLHDGVVTYAATVLTMGINLVTGILVARALGATGRGELTAIIALPAAFGWIFGVGGATAVSFRQARHPGNAGRLMTSWLIVTLPLAASAVLAGELSLRWILAAQTASTVHLAQLYLLTVLLVPIPDTLFGVLLGDQDFQFFNLIRVLQPALVAAGYVALALAGQFSVASALLANVLSAVFVAAMAAARALGRYGLGRPSVEMGRTTLWFGLRAHGTTVSSLLNERLDLLIIPAFLGAGMVGLYAVATSVSWMVVALSGPLAAIITPAAARQGREGVRTVIRSMHVSVAVATIVATCLGIFASLALRFVYGVPFASSATAVRILLPGSVLYVAANMFCSGLYAANAPFSATLAHAAGLVVTIPGLMLFLHSGGILAAALVSTASYAVVFCLSLGLYKRVTRTEWRAFLPARETFDFDAGRRAWAMLRTK